jgi:hypothetical protein
MVEGTRRCVQIEKRKEPGLWSMQTKMDELCINLKCNLDDII